MAKKKQSDNEIINELVAAATPEVSSVIEEIIAAPVIEVEVPKPAKAAATKAPGMYHNGRLITAVPAKIGKKWSVVIDGKREKVLKSEIEIIN
jgi:hypothetical protein